MLSHWTDRRQLFGFSTPRRKSALIQPLAARITFSASAAAAGNLLNSSGFTTNVSCSSTIFTLCYLTALPTERHRLQTTAEIRSSWARGRSSHSVGLHELRDRALRVSRSCRPFPPWKTTPARRRRSLRYHRFGRPQTMAACLGGS